MNTGTDVQNIEHFADIGNSVLQASTNLLRSNMQNFHFFPHIQTNCLVSLNLIITFIATKLIPCSICLFGKRK